MTELHVEDDCWIQFGPMRLSLVVSVDGSYNVGATDPNDGRRYFWIRDDGTFSFNQLNSSNEDDDFEVDDVTFDDLIEGMKFHERA